MLRTFMIVLLALAWVPLTSHCRLEAVTGFEFLRCATDAHNACAAEDATCSHEPTESGDPCESDACCAFEFAKYSSSRPQELIPSPVLAVVAANPLDRFEPTFPSEVSANRRAAPPPDLPRCWHFSLRVALPVRAPSLAS